MEIQEVRDEKQKEDQPKPATGNVISKNVSGAGSTDRANGGHANPGHKDPRAAQKLARKKRLKAGHRRRLKASHAKG